MTSVTRTVELVLSVSLTGEVDDGTAVDAAVDGLFAQVLVDWEAVYPNRPRVPITVSTNLLNGVDTFDANIIQLLENILSALGDRVDEALLEPEA